MGDAISVTDAWFAILMIVSIYFQKQANRDLTVDYVKFVLLDLILPDQPNRAVRTRMLRGVGGGSCEAPPYPDVCRARPGC